MLNIYCGKTLFDGYKSLFARLKAVRQAEFGASHIFVVPDRFSMSCEKDIFEYLNIESTFDIKVLTMSRFASAIISKKINVVPKSTSSMLVQKILIDNRAKLKCFSKTKLTSGFASEIFETINQLKSSCIKPEELVCNGDDLLSQKMTDIKFIYEEYEKKLSQEGLVDSADKFTLFEGYLPESEMLKGAYIYISHFDSFTKQGYLILKQFLKKAKEVNISVAASNIGANSHIYLNDVYTNVLAMARDLKIEPNIIECSEKLNETFEHIKNNLFSYNPQNIILKQNNLTLSCHDSFVKECEFVALSIKKYLTQGDRYRDMSVIVPNLKDNQNVIKKVFDDFGFNSYCDTTITLSGSILDKFINILITLKTKYYKKEDLIKLIKSPILGLEESYVFELENYIITKNIEGKSLFRKDSVLEEFRQKIGPVLSFINELKTSDTYGYFASKFLEFFDLISVQNRLDDISKDYFAKGYLDKSRILDQVYEKSVAALRQVYDIFGDSPCDIYEFLDVLQSGFESINLSITPVSVDSIFIGDSSKSFFERTKHFFVIGAKEGSLPMVSSDCGIITDGEINKMASLYKIEPTIKTINQRERFKLFNTLIMPKESLHISYSQSQGKVEKASFVGYIESMFSIYGRNGKTVIETLNDDYNYLTFCEKIGSFEHAEKLLAGFIRNIEDGLQYTNIKEIGSLYDAIKDRLPYLREYKQLTCFEKNNTIKTNLFFGKGTLSVSEIERYYACPFKHYLDYGLKLKENRIETFDNMQVGNYLHRVAEIFVQDNIEYLPISSDMKDLVDDICDKVLSSEEFIKLKENEDNILSIKSIKKEALRMCKAINYQIENSSFKPVLTEARFDDKGVIKSLEISVKNKKLKIVGAIDRVDIFEDYFRIIDYKTGKCDSSLKELYFGKKLQLYVYQKVVQESLNKTPSGAYYFPVKNSFADEGQEAYSSYKLKGYTDSLHSVVYATDNNLEQKDSSNIISVRKKKNSDAFDSRSELLSSEEILLLAEYAMKSLMLATAEIMEGNIKASPLGNDEEEACKYCPYKAICRFDETLGDKTRSTRGNMDIKIIKEGINGKD